MKSLIIIIIALICIYLGWIIWMKKTIETPRYQVDSKHNNIEIRTYQPKLIATVTTQGDRKSAINKGFRQLASFIFGENHTDNHQHKKIKMTAPVLQQSTKINMTAPVEQQQISDQTWQTSFVMPSKYKLNTLPKPNNSSIKIKQIPKEKMVVIKFSGALTQDNIKKHEDQLIAYCHQHQLQIIGDPIYAFYDAPWTLPNLRRNEVMFHLTE